MANMTARPGRPRAAWTLTYEEVQRRYEAGESLWVLAQACGLKSSNPVRNRLLENGVTLRAQGPVPGRRRPMPTRKILRTCRGGDCCNLFSTYPSSNKRYCSPGCRYADPHLRRLLAGSIESKHRLTSVDEVSLTGECSVCGPTRVRIRSDRRDLKFAAPITRYRCRTAERARDLAHRLGISLAEVERLLSEQGFCCAVCRRTLFAVVGHGAQVDHCHTTGRVRGLLCSPCNTAIGLLGDDTARLAAAITYLNRSRKGN